jgi:aminopeptidase N
MRWILGDKPFRKTVSHFLHKHAFQPADTHDFLTAVKEATGQNLDWFFDQWLLRPGHPVFDVSTTWDAEAKELHLRVVQTQDTSGTVPIFKTPVIIGIVTQDEKRSEKVWLKGKNEEFHLMCDQKPLMVRFDEGNYLLKEWTFEKTVDELFYQLKHDDVIGRMWAASQLGRFRNDSRAIDELRKSAKDDPFWAVRREAVSSLGGFQDEKHIKFIQEKAEDENSKVRTVALRYLGDLERKDLVTFFQERFAKDDSYVAQAEALRAIGKCGDKSSVPFLKEAAKLKSPRHIIRRAAEWAIEQNSKK